MAKAKKKVAKKVVKKAASRKKTEQRQGVERRGDEDRRTTETPVAVEQRIAPRRKVQRRRQIDPTTCERDYSSEEVEFMHALDDYKRRSGRMFPTCSEILEVVKAMGYERVSSAAPAKAK